jgi:alpha-tubulin suppressor-like RCC1 family protein
LESITNSGAIRAGKLYLWGSGGYGGLGDGTYTEKLVPTEIIGYADWDKIVRSFDISFGIRNGELYSWGRGDKGLLGNGTREHSNIPKKVGDLKNWEDLSISAMQTHILGLRDGKLYAWGMNDNGEFGDGTTSLRSTPTQIKEGGKWDFIASGNKHSLGIRDGKLYGWGANGAGGIDSTYGTKYSPVQIGAYDDWEYVAAGNQHSLGIRNGKLYGWGANYYCPLGNGREGANPRLEGVIAFMSQLE